MIKNLVYISKKNYLSKSFFSFPLFKYAIFTSIQVFRDFTVLVRCCFVCRLCTALFVFFVFFRCLFNSDCQINFNPVQIQPMTLALSTLHILRHSYSGYFNIVIIVSLCTLSFYSINMDVVSLPTSSSLLLLTNLYCIDILYQFEWMNVIFFCQIIYHFCLYFISKGRSTPYFS